MMNAAVVTRYGAANVVQLRQLERPRPRPNEVLVRVHAASVSAADWRIRSASVPLGFGMMVRLFFGLRGPRQPVLGTELSGVVEEVGALVERFAPGDRVFAYPGGRMGAHAEYVTMAHDGMLQHVPTGMNLTDAAALCFGGTTALYYLRDKAKLQPGEKIVIVGAAGSVGSAAVSLAKHFGAEVTAVCSSNNVDFVRSLGADHVIDYTQADFTQNGQRYDVVMDCAGTAPFARCKESLATGGRLLLVVATLPELLSALWQRRGGVKVFAGTAPERPEDMATLADLCVRGVFRPHISKRFPIEQIQGAHALVESQHKRGNAVVLFSHHDNP
jgi:NADPH:quinone reductase-like Zn-dependent oxidoreductase